MRIRAWICVCKTHSANKHLIESDHFRNSVTMVIFRSCRRVMIVNMFNTISVLIMHRNYAAASSTRSFRGIKLAVLVITISITMSTKQERQAQVTLYFKWMGEKDGCRQHVWGIRTYMR